MFPFAKPKAYLDEISTSVVDVCLIGDMKENVERLFRESNNGDRLQLMREYIGFRAFAMYNGSRAAFGRDKKTWQRYVAAVGESFSKRLVQDRVFTSIDEFSRFVDERGTEYNSLWHGSFTENVPPKDNPVFKLTLRFANHVGIVDPISLTAWGALWVNWSTLDKQLVDKLLREARIV